MNEPSAAGAADRASAPFSASICGLDEIAGYAGAGYSGWPVTHVLSILDPGFDDPAAFGSFGEHERLTLRFHDIIDAQPGMTAPDAGDVAALLGFGRALTAEIAPSAHLLVHCHMGISRSTAAMWLLMVQDRPGEIDQALAEILRIRPIAWPNTLIVELGDAELGLAGRMVEALRDHQRRALATRPELAESLIAHGRGREVRV